MPSARVLYAGLAILDHQIIARDGTRCGKVDDLELDDGDGDGDPMVDAILTGPGALLTRTGHGRLGSWLRHEVDRVADHDRPDPVRVPIRSVADIGNHVTLSIDADQVATFAAERWVRDHIIGHIPGSHHDPAQ